MVLDYRDAGIRGIRSEMPCKKKFHFLSYFDNPEGMNYGF
jgi:hypothetical protein